MIILKSNKFLLLIAIVFILFILRANPVTETLAPTDILYEFPGWQNIEYNEGFEHWIRSDVLDTWIPMWKNIKTNLRNGNIPYLNNNRSGGQLGILGWSGINLSLLMFIIVENDALGFYLGAFIKLLIGFTGMFFFLSKFFKSKLAICFSTITFAINGYHAAWFFWPHVNTSVWLPWLLWGTLKILEIEVKKKDMLLFVSIFSLLLLAWFPSVAVYCIYTLAIFVILWNLVYFEGISSLIRKNSKLVILSMFTGGICAFYIFPWVELLNYYDFSWRVGGTPLKYKDILLFINPYHLGDTHPETTFFCGKVGVAFAILSFIFFLKKNENRNILLLKIFATLITLLAIIICFGILNKEIIESIPSFSFNNYNRIGIIACFGIAILGGIFIEELLELLTGKVQYIGIGVLTLALAYQSYDLKNLFNDFNGVVEKEYFFPDTPTLSHVAKNSGRFDYTVADKAYIISGIIGYYGINEWYAQSYRTIDEKKLVTELLKEPFATPTASFFDMSQLNNTKLLDIMSIRYLLTTSDMPVGKKAAGRYKGGYKAIEITNNHWYNKNVSFLEPIKFDGIKLFFGTYNNNPLIADSIKIRIEDRGEILFEDKFFNQELYDNQWHTIKFDDTISVSNAITLSVNISDEKTFAFWAEEDGFIGHELEYVNNASKKEWKEYQKEKGIKIYENLELPHGPYIVDNLNEIDELLEYEGITYKELDDTAIEIDLNKSKIPTDKYLVVPIRDYPAWAFYDEQGNMLHKEKYLNVFPAIKLTSGLTSKIKLAYHSNYLFYGGLVSIISLILLVIYTKFIPVFRLKNTL